MRGERMPNAIRNFEGRGYWQLFDREKLPDEERRAVDLAEAEYKRSTNPEYHAGACAVAQDGTVVAKHNEYHGENKGQEGHAEMVALTALYRAVDSSQKKLKILAVAGANPDDELVRVDKPYAKNVRLNDIKGSEMCGRCRKFVSDFTGNFLNAETGKDNPNDRGPIILLITETGQILRTDLRTLYPMPYVPRIMYPESLSQDVKGSPDQFDASNN